MNNFLGPRKRPLRTATAARRTCPHSPARRTSPISPNATPPSPTSETSPFEIRIGAKKKYQRRSVRLAFAFWATSVSPIKSLVYARPTECECEQGLVWSWDIKTCCENKETLNPKVDSNKQTNKLFANSLHTRRFIFRHQTPGLNTYIISYRVIINTY